MKLCGQRPGMWLLGCIALAGSAPGAHAVDLKILQGGPGGIDMTVTGITGAKPNEKGTLNILVKGKPFKVLGQTAPGIPGVPVDNLAADAAGNVTGGHIDLTQVLTDDASVGDLFGTGVGLSISKDTNISVTKENGVPKATFKGTTSVRLPLYSDDGKPLKVTLPGGLTLDGAGDLSLKVTGAAVDPPETGLAGLGLAVKTLDGNIEFNKGVLNRQTWSIKAHDVTVTTPLPSLLTQSPLSLHSDEVDLDPDYQPTFTASYPAPADAGKNQVIHLAQPLDFALDISKAGLTVQKGTVSGFTVTANLALPPYITDADGHAVELPLQADSDFKNGTLATYTPAAPLKLKWNSLQMEVDKPVVLDLSENSGSAQEPGVSGANQADKNKWKGIFFQEIKLQMPDVFPGATITSKNFFVDGNGLTGSINAADFQNAANLQMDGFGVNITGGEIDFKRNAVEGGNLQADLLLPDWSTNASLPLRIGMTPAGLVTAAVEPKEDGYLIPISAIDLNAVIHSAALQIGPDGMPGLTLSGEFQFGSTFPEPTLQGYKIGFTNLGVAAPGKIHFPNEIAITPPEPVKIDMHVAVIEVEKVSFGETNAQKLYCRLDGGVKLAADLPLTGGVDFGGLTITEPDKLIPVAPPDINFGSVHLLAQVKGVVTLEAKIAKQKVKVVTSRDSQGNPQMDDLDCLYGSAAISLDFAGPPPTAGSGSMSGGPGGAVYMMVAHKVWPNGDSTSSWYVTADVALANAAIPLGNTGLALFGFHGGIGHNVVAGKFDDDFKKAHPRDAMQQEHYLDHIVGVDDSAVGVPVRDYPLIPDLSADNWMVLAGVRLGTQDGRTAGGDVILSVLTEPLHINLNGKFWFLEDFTGLTPVDDRTAVINLDYTNARFLATARGDFYFPSKATSVFDAHGGLEFLISSSDKHLYAGWPLSDDRALTFNVSVGGKQISGPRAGLGIQFAGAGAVAPVAQPNAWVTPPWLNGGLTWATSYSSGDIDIGVATVDVDLGGSIAAYFFVSFGDPRGPYADGSADLSAWANINAHNALGSVQLGANVEAHLVGVVHCNLYSSSPTMDGSFEGDLDVGVSAFGGDFHLHPHYATTMSLS